MASSSLPPPSSASPDWKHDVFPSFYGPDVRRSFFSYILAEFTRKGLDTFIDSSIARGKSISFGEGIRVSKVAIVILSRNYASSMWCLDELLEIMKCAEELGQKVVPIFYKVDPSDVKKQTGYFGEVFRKTCKGKTKKHIDRWRQALEKVATIPGHHSCSWDDEVDMIKELFLNISNTLQSIDFEPLVGMRGHMEKMEPLLCLESDDVRMIGICGPYGIGKSTIARCLYNKLKISPQFQLSVFMENIKGRYPTPCYDEYSAKLQLQQDFLSQMNQNDTRISHLGVLRERLHDQRVLVFLDDVDSLGQIDTLAQDISWFGPGSRIIITTEDHRLLRAHRIDAIYKVDFPSSDEVFQIFCLHAFGQNSPPCGEFESLAREVTTLSGKYPLGLRFMGSYLRGMSKEEWKNELPRLLSSLDGNIESIIKFTYNSSDDKVLSHLHISHGIDRIDKVDVSSTDEALQIFSELKQDLVITNQDLKEDLYTSERAVKHNVYIYCEDRLQYSFASHLSMDFRRKCIDAFVNYNEIPDVIERLSASVVIFSKGCFSSTSCLDKLVRVLQWRRKTGQLVVPVFYGISPSDLVVQEHESADRIREWSSALQELRELPAHQSREEFSERELVEAIVKNVYEKLFPTQQIGINSRLMEIEQLLCKQPWGIRYIGIWGMPGIGKTALAKAVFDQISGEYEGSCFIKNFDKAFHEKGLHRLLVEHFGEILRPSLPRDKLRKIRAFVVLDDVHSSLVAESFLGEFHWFGPGSLVIITSRDKQVFRHFQINHVYEVQSLNENEALQLFSQCAFGKDIREQKLLELSMEVIDCANGNPLALRFYGRELKGKKLSDMETTFLKLKLRTPYKIYDLLKSSYEALNDNEKNIFLDIACFFEGEHVDYVMQLLEGCGFFPHVGIDVLVDKCMVTISENRVKMHRIIQDFGREISNGETVQIERRRRLWESRTIKFLLEDDKLEAFEDPKATYTRAMGTEDIEGIFLDISNLIFDVKPVAFENMLSLRFLKIYCSSYETHYGLRLPKGLESLPYELRLLHWESYPLQSLPQDFDPCHLVELNLSYSQLQKLWGGTNNLEMLKVVRLCHSQQLTEINDISKAQNIELIDLQGCTKLQSFPAMGHLQYLRVVNLSGCTEIRTFPEVSPNIEELHLQGTGIRELPLSTVTLSPHVKLNRELSNFLTEFPGVSDALNHKLLRSLGKAVSSNEHLGKLVCLNMKDCVHLRSLPHMADLESLKVLNLSGCSELDNIQGFPLNLKELYLAGIAVKELPQLPLSLEVLNAHGCVSLEAIPLGFKQLPKYYTFSGCSALSPQVVTKFLAKALADVEAIVREYEQEQELNESLAFSFSVPSPATKKSTLGLPAGSSAMMRLDPSSLSTLLGFVILIEVAFSDDYNEDIGFGVRCVRRWKDNEGVSRSLEKTFHCWIPGEGLPKFQKDHLFVFCDLNLHALSGKGEDPSDIFAGLVVFDFFPVNKQEKLLEGSCTVKSCEVKTL